MSSDFLNWDSATISSTGDEWKRFDQRGMSIEESKCVCDDYFSIFPWDQLPADPEGFDKGCGSGRWARYVAPRVGLLHCIDPSSALEVARRNLDAFNNVQFFKAAVASSGLLPNSQDFGYSLGVLHHIPDTSAAIRSCTDLLKPGAPLLIYLYYKFDNRPFWIAWLWSLSNFLRLLIIRCPPRIKQLIADIIAYIIYWPMAKVAAVADSAGLPVGFFPLSSYRNCTIYTMRTDSRDRFGTPLEHRFTRAEIYKMCTDAGLIRMTFSTKAPFWCVVGFKKSS